MSTRSSCSPRDSGAKISGRQSSSSAPEVPEPYAPPTCAVPPFPPIRSGGLGSRRLLALRRDRKALTVALSVTAAALAATAAHGAAPRPLSQVRVPHRPATAAAPAPYRELVVRAPVRIADAAVAELLHPGDRVDVLAGARTVASAATVVSVPTTHVAPAAAVIPDSGAPGGALIVLAVPRHVAASLSGAATSSPLAVTLC